MKNLNLVLTALLLAGFGAGGAEVQRVTSRETDALLTNPGMGWMSGHRSPVSELRFPSIGKLRGWFLQCLEKSGVLVSNAWK
ncbi:MAG: hypothetical protein NTY53_10310 [Kiritimatiellaeota bacterium]|nr:hypothetical protein [Kiritimatiellota bacterium]